MALEFVCEFFIILRTLGEPIERELSHKLVTCCPFLFPC